jgi:pimeloyl-ACP methyl ester carboxylesterase
LRDGPIRGQSIVFQSKAFEDKKVLIIHVYCHFSLVLWKLTVFLQGTKDSTVHPKYSPLIATLLPASTQKKLVTIEGAGHGLTVSHPKDVTDEVSAFFG